MRLHCRLPFVRHVSSIRSVSRSFSISALRQNAIQLRDYQEASITSVLDYLAKGHHRLGLSLATGSGKTVIFTHLIDRVPQPDSNATRTLVIAHRRELVEQAAKHCRNVYPDLDIEIEMGKDKASGNADITIASISSINRRLDKYDPSTYKLVVVDEAHHITAPSYLSLLEHFKLHKTGESSTALVGVSATFSRSDGVSLGSAIDHIVYHRDYIDMIEGNYLSGLIFTTVQTEVDLSEVKVARGDYTTAALSVAVNTEQTNKLVVQSWLTKASKRESTLVFCVDISHVNAVTDTFRQFGIDARSVIGASKTEERAEVLKAFRAKEFPVLVNCGIFTEGTDIPNIDCVVLARPTKSRNLLVQMIGRGLRKFEGKKDCHVIDMVAALQQGIVTTPTLFGLDPQEIVTEADVATMQELKGSRPVKSPANIGAIMFEDFDSIHDFLKASPDSQKMRSLSILAWVAVGPEKYILSNRDGSYITVKQVEDKFEVTMTRKLLASKSPFMRPMTIATALTREAAIRAADTFAKQHFEYSYTMRWAGWRRNPATDSQLAFLNKTTKHTLQAFEVTKGEASDWLTRLKHGAKGRFNMATKQRDKITKAQRQIEADKRVGLQGPIL